MRIRLIFAAVLAVFAISAPLASAGSTGGNGGGPAGKVTICHLTGSQTNPVVIITVSRNALPAHLRHGDLIFNGRSCVHVKK